LDARALTRRWFPVPWPGVRGRSGWLRHVKHCAVGLVSVALCLAVPQARAQQNPSSEYAIKAAFLFHFAEFVDWPVSSFAGRDSPFFVCVIGEDLFGPLLDESLLGKKVGEHPVQIGRFPSLKALGESHLCHIVFLSASLRSHFREAIESFCDANALLVGDMPNFAASGGAIELTLEENHVRFMINPDAAERAGLRVSSKLLSLAKIVHDSPGNGRG
jgi:uncharacterized protein DUF4154